MHLFKFSLLSCLLMASAFGFDDNACFKNSFDVEVIHKGKPFGLFPVVLKIQKNDCDIVFYHEKLKYQKANWKVDICREPVHIKKGFGAVEVIKKTQNCGPKSADGFCIELEQIEKNIQDDGLIFAEGQKENLRTDHGKAYCAYLLLKKYLRDDHVFTRDRNYEGMISGSSPTPSTTNPVEEKTEIQAPRPVIDGSETQTISLETQAQQSSQENANESTEAKAEETGKGSF